MGRKIVVTAPAAGTVLCGTCWVVDGDTIVIDGFHIRLAGIDAPELDHPWGQRSKWALVALCKGHKITARLRPDLSYNRLVAECFLPDGRDLAAEMVIAGLALDWPKFSGGHYKHLEPVDARRKLWRTALRQGGAIRQPQVAPLPTSSGPSLPPAIRRAPEVQVITQDKTLPRRNWRWLGWFAVPGALLLVASCALGGGGASSDSRPAAASKSTPALTRPVQSAVVFEVTSSALNVRERPSASSTVIGELVEGTPVVPKAVSGSWIGIELGGGGTGWVYGQYLREVGAAERAQ